MQDKQYSFFTEEYRVLKRTCLEYKQKKTTMRMFGIHLIDSCRRSDCARERDRDLNAYLIAITLEVANDTRKEQRGRCVPHCELEV